MAPDLDGLDDTPPASERFSSMEDVMAAGKEENAAERAAQEPEEEYFGYEAELPPASEARAVTEEPEESAEEAPEPKAEKPADEEPETDVEAAATKFLLDGEEVDPDDVKEWRAAHKVSGAFEREVTKREDELRGIHETLTSQAAQIEKKERELEAYQRYLENQGIEAGDPFTESITGGRVSEPEQSASDRPMTAADFDRMYKERREAERTADDRVSREQRLISNFETFVDDGLDSAGFEKGTWAWQTAREAASFRFFTAFKGDPDKVLAMSEAEQRAVIERSARAMGKQYRAEREKSKAADVDKMKANKGNLPATPRLAGSPVPEQAAPERRKSVAEVVSKLGSMDGYFDTVKRRMRAQLDRNRKG